MILTETLHGADFDVDVANAVLAHFVENSRKNWMQALREAFEDEDQALDKLVPQIQEQLELLEKDRPYGVFIGSTATAKEVHEDGEAVVAAIRGLKANFRLFQAGRGRGRAIVVMDETPLSGTAPTAHRATDLPPAVVHRDEEPTPIDVNATLLTLRNTWLNMESENASLRATSEDLVIQLESAQRRIQELLQRLGEAPVPATDW